MNPDEPTSNPREFALIYHDVRKAIGNPVAIALYVILVEYADSKTQQASPSRSELANQLGFKKAASVDKYLDILQEVGVVTVMPGYENKDGARSIEKTEEFFIPTSNLYVLHDLPRAVTSYRRPTGDKRGRNTYPEAFEEWWRTYPRRRNASKKAAHTQWQKAIKEVDAQRLLDLTAAYARNPGVSDERYIPHPQKWLKDQRWESIEETNTGGVKQSQPSGIDAWLGFEPTGPQSDIVDAEVIDTKELPGWTG